MRKVAVALKLQAFVDGDDLSNVLYRVLDDDVVILRDGAWRLCGSRLHNVHDCMHALARIRAKAAGLNPFDDAE